MVHYLRRSQPCCRTASQRNALRWRNGASDRTLHTILIATHPILSFITFPIPNRQRLGQHRQAAVVLGTTTALLTMRVPTDSPSRSAGFLALLCAGASLVASGLAVVRLWRLSSASTHPFGTAGSLFSEFLPALAGGGEAIVVLDLRSAFTMKASLPPPIALPCTPAA